MIVGRKDRLQQVAPVIVDDSRRLFSVLLLNCLSSQMRYRSKEVVCSNCLFENNHHCVGCQE